jgi:large subunit ribosomal protein L21
VPSPDSALTAVVASGGKQYRVAPGDRVLVDRLAAEPGAEIKLGRVLMVADGEDFKVGSSALDGVTVVARVIRHARGPKIDAFRYKSKKRVRVRHGSRAELTALEILEIGGKGRPQPQAQPEAEPKRGRRRAAAGKAEPVQAEPVQVEPVQAEPVKAEAAAAPKTRKKAATASAEQEAKPAPKRTRARKAPATEEEDGS